MKLLFERLLLQINLPESVFQRFHQAKDVLKETANHLNQSAKLTKESLGQTANKVVDNVTATGRQAQDSLTTTTHKAVDSVTTATSDSVNRITENIGQTKNSLEGTVQNAIASSISDWLQDHPVAFRLVQVLLWASNHPIVSLIALLFGIAIAFSLIKAIGRLIETAGLSLLLAPFKLIIFLIKLSFQSLGNLSGLAFKQLAVNQNPEILALPPATSEPIPTTKQQRLSEISTRLEAIQKEQNELLQEVAAILESDKMNIEV